MDEMRVGSLVGTLTCHEFLLRILAGAIQDPLPPPFLWFRIWISFLGINSPPPPRPYSLGGNVNQATRPLTPQAKRMACGLHQANRTLTCFQGFESWVEKPVGTYPLQQ